MKHLDSLFLEIINDGAITPEPRRFPTKKEKDQIDLLLSKQLRALYRSAVDAGDLDDFQLSSTDKTNITNSLKNVLSVKTVAANKSLIDTSIKDFVWRVNNAGKIKALIEDSDSLET